MNLINGDCNITNPRSIILTRSSTKKFVNQPQRNRRVSRLVPNVRCASHGQQNLKEMSRIQEEEDFRLNIQKENQLMPPIEINNILKEFKSIQTKEYGSCSNIPEFFDFKQEKQSYWSLFYRQLFPENKQRQTILKKIIIQSAAETGKKKSRSKFNRTKYVNMRPNSSLDEQNASFFKNDLKNVYVNSRLSEYKDNSDCNTECEDEDEDINISKLIEYRKQKERNGKYLSTFKRYQKKFGTIQSFKFKEILSNTQNLEESLLNEKRFTQNLCQTMIKDKSLKRACIKPNNTLILQRSCIREGLNTSVLCDKSCEKVYNYQSIEKSSTNCRTSTRGATDCKIKIQQSGSKLIKANQRRSHYIDRKFESCDVIHDFSPAFKKLREIKSIARKSHLCNIKRNTTKDKRDFALIPLESPSISPDKDCDIKKTDEYSQELSYLSTSVAPFLNSNFDPNKNSINDWFLKSKIKYIANKLKKCLDHKMIKSMKKIDKNDVLFDTIYKLENCQLKLICIKSIVKYPQLRVFGRYIGLLKKYQAIVDLDVRKKIMNQINKIESIMIERKAEKLKIYPNYINSDIRCNSSMGCYDRYRDAPEGHIYSLFKIKI